MEFPDNWERYEFAAGFVKGRRVVDVACGCGYGTALLGVASGLRPIGLDVSSEAIAWARQYYGATADYERIQPSLTWPVPDAGADVVISLETVEHVPDADEFLTEIARVLPPGGELILSTPCCDSEARFRPENPFHLREYSWTELAELLGRNGFQVLDRWSQVSALSARWAQVKASSTGPLLVGFKGLFPRSWVDSCRSFLARRSRLKKGSIVHGRVDAVAVQLVRARLADKRKRLHG